MRKIRYKLSCRTRYQSAQRMVDSGVRFEECMVAVGDFLSPFVVVILLPRLGVVLESYAI